jgi:hypothetical protein
MDSYHTNGVHRVATTYRALAALKHEVEMGTVNAHRAVAVRKILSLNRNAPGKQPSSGYCSGRVDIVIWITMCDTGL